jgi:hypothetical protein
MTDDKLSSERFAPTPSVTNFERHVQTFRNLNGVTVTHTDEENGQIALVMDKDDESLQEQAEQVAKDRFYDVTAGYREDIDEYCMVLEEQ